MERYCHNPISDVEGLLDSIAMMDVHVQIEHTLMVLQQLKNGKHDVIGIAEPTGLTFFSVV